MLPASASGVQTRPDLFDQASSDGAADCRRPRCNRRAPSWPVPRAERARYSYMSEVLGYGFFPTLMTIALLSRNWSVRFGWQGIPAPVRALLRASSAASAARLSGPTNAATPESCDVPAVLPRRRRRGGRSGTALLAIRPTSTRRQELEGVPTAQGLETQKSRKSVPRTPSVRRRSSLDPLALWSWAP